jgi:hypothetical protein
MIVFTRMRLSVIAAGVRAHTAAANGALRGWVALGRANFRANVRLTRT